MVLDVAVLQVVQLELAALFMDFVELLRPIVVEAHTQLAKLPIVVLASAVHGVDIAITEAQLTAIMANHCLKRRYFHSKVNSRARQRFTTHLWQVLTSVPVVSAAVFHSMKMAKKFIQLLSTKLISIHTPSEVSPAAILFVKRKLLSKDLKEKSLYDLLTAAVAAQKTPLL